MSTASFRLSILQDVTANGIGREPFQALKKRQVVILEKVLSNSEPVIPKTSGFNSKTPFLSEKDVEEEVMEKYSTHAQSDKNFKAFRECPPCRIAEIIDYSCRFLFPLCFVVFNVLYWRHYLKEWLYRHRTNGLVFSSWTHLLLFRKYFSNIWRLDNKKSSSPPLRHLFVVEFWDVKHDLNN